MSVAFAQHARLRVDGEDVEDVGNGEDAGTVYHHVSVETAADAGDDEEHIVAEDP